METDGMAELEATRRDPAAGPAQQLVVLCHGVGANGRDLIDLAPVWAQALPHAAFVAPDGPEPYDMAPTGRQWFSLIDRTPAKLLAGVAVAAGALDRFVTAEAARLGLGRDSVALMGFSQGAMTVLHTGLAYGPNVGGILSFSGAWLPPPVAAARPPVLIVHGEADDVVPVFRSREAEAALRRAGVDVTALYRPRVGHWIDDAGLTAGAQFLTRVFAAHAKTAS
ncbi:MAG TPA: prolyl oligopeptidase family serine peptidase [Acetobacteraceae bacterium]|jgi:phospholipase/carboxylesterase|nr:prolyl oligopeptidase family serine peptidase [Acetobacteraceae bacterium]